MRRFLHCYGPAAPADLQAWLGSSPQQAKRLWSAAAEEMEPVRVLGRTRWALIRDRDSLTAPPEQPGRLILLGPHDCGTEPWSWRTPPASARSGGRSPTPAPF